MRYVTRRNAGIVALLAVLLWGGWVFSRAAWTVSLAQGTQGVTGVNRSSHGARTMPDYQRLFAMDRVHEIRLTIAPDRFQGMQADLATIGPPGGMPGFGPPGRGGRGGMPGFGSPPGGAGGGPPGGLPDMAALMEAGRVACEGKASGDACAANGMKAKCAALLGGPMMCVPEVFANMARGGAMKLTTREPIVIPVTVTHDGEVWTQVAMRYKGNSTLVSTAASGNGKVPFRLDFDHYKNGNQRFYGFRKLTFSSNFGDDSQLHDTLGSEILRDRGVPAPRTAFYRVFVDVGMGAQYWGLYTMIEDPADGAMLDAQFGRRDGNLYKPDGPGANWTEFATAGFPKKTNKSVDNYRDVEAAIRALHAPRDNPQAWRTALEAVFNVDLFLRWLAVNTVMEDWDSYGVMAHNYYLYADPAHGGQLQWIPWDHNFAFGAGPGMPGGGGPGRGGVGAGMPGAGGPGRGSFGPGMPGGRGPGRGGFPFGGVDILAQKVGDSWPLLKRVMADEVYAARYRELLVHAMGGLFAPNAFDKRARELHALIASSLVGPAGERPTHTTLSSADAFERSLDGPDGLLQHVRGRQAAVRAALAEATRR